MCVRRKKPTNEPVFKPPLLATPSSKGQKTPIGHRKSTPELVKVHSENRLHFRQRRHRIRIGRDDDTLRHLPMQMPEYDAEKEPSCSKRINEIRRRELEQRSKKETRTSRLEGTSHTSHFSREGDLGLIDRSK